MNNLDLSISKALTRGGRVRLEVRLDMFNALNHTQFSGVNNTVVFASLADSTVANIHVSFYLTGVCHPVELLDLTSGEHRPLPELGQCVTARAVDPSGRLAATGDQDGVVRVASLSGGRAHLLLGHQGPVQGVAIAPDLRWVATTGEDDTLRLWPMPDLDQPPLHTLPHDALVARLKSLTNLRAVRSSESATGWTIDLDPFPGWEEVPEW